MEELIRARVKSQVSDKEVRHIVAYLRKKFGEDGLVSAEDFVDAARPKNSPLHKYLEWDDGAAADAWRLQQARQCLNAIEVAYVEDDAPPVWVRGYFNVVTAEGDRVYAPISVVKVTHEYDQQVRDRFARELLSIHDRMKSYDELEPVVQVVAQARELLAA